MPPVLGDRIQPGTFHLWSRHRHAVNYAGASGLVSIVDRTVGTGPVNITFDESLLPCPVRLDITVAGINLDGRPSGWSGSPVYDSSLPDRAADKSCLERGMKVFRDTLLKIAPPLSLAFVLDPRRQNAFKDGFGKLLVTRVLEAAQAGKKGGWIRMVSLLKGCGYGLTPGGDDFIAGFLTAIHLIPDGSSAHLSGVIASTLHLALGSNPISNAAIRMAAEGRVSEKCRSLVVALIENDPEWVADQAYRVIRQGETSGADWGSGFLFAFDEGVESWLLSAELSRDSILTA